MKFSNREYLGFATYARSKSGQWRLHFNWTRIGVVLGCLAVAGYLSLAFMLYCWFRYKQDCDGAKYSEMLVYPFSRETRIQLRKDIGDKMIADAKTEFRENQDFSAYFQKVREGLIYSPFNPDGRINFSQVLFWQKRSREAVEFLRDGLPYAVNNKDYVRFFVQQCLENAQDDTLISSAETLLPLFPIAAKTVPEPNELSDNRLMLVVGAAQASLFRGRFDAAEKILETYDVLESLSGRVLMAQIYWESGKREQALTILKSAQQAVPGNEQIALLYAVYLKEIGDLRAARDVLTRLALIKNDPTIRVRIITLFPGDENLQYRRLLESEFFKRYQNDSSALLALAQYATNAKEYDLVEEIYKHARAETLVDLPKFEMLYLEMLILSGKSADALKELDELGKGNYAWVRNYQGVLDCLRALAYYSNNQVNLGEICLDRVMRNRSVPAARLIVLARRLEEFGFEEEARNVYESAFLIENGNQTALLELVHYALRHNDVSVLLRYLPPLLETRRPPRAVLEEVQNFLGSDRMLFIPKRDSLITGVSQMLDDVKNDKISTPDDTVLKSWF